MFQTLTQKLSNIFDKIKGSTALSEQQVLTIAREVRIALLEADVSLVVIKDFINNVVEKAKGQEVLRSVTPGQMVIKIISDEMIKVLSSSETEQALHIEFEPPVNIMMIGLQGSGKTTTTAKLAMKLAKKNKKVMVVSLDIYRPAAREQLETLVRNHETILSLPIVSNENVFQIIARSTKEAKLLGCDVVIYDTAGRLHIDETMLQELSNIKEIITPKEILLVVDSLIGQESVNVANQFNQTLNISGVVLTKIDGDSRGGAALSIKYVTGKPIKFLGTGEKTNDLEEFHPERIASRILGKGDIVSLVEKAAEVISKEDAAKSVEKLKKGSFNLEDYYQQLQNINKMGGISSILNLMPGINKLLPKIDQNPFDQNNVKLQQAIILSMTRYEKLNPDIINGKRKKRIAAGSGTSVQEVNKLLKQFQNITSLLKSGMKGNNILKDKFNNLKNFF
ncbi:signal recognition particle protein [Orientia tsutsugamushi]|uniref:Signal recognition particle protein n=1 Tax=Orientia tsutsugamushi TaxID=784 RepID=A0A2U3RG52_ORITS|nr:signal recognition particle protein [Orientia tsutsugamushi]KJV55420.1 signal recognition particle protein [Orientia tsutsugamushi str. Kato PP]SPR12193.1 signal recognition particle protein [Orientia tsutsugamushi]